MSSIPRRIVPATQQGGVRIETIALSPALAEVYLRERAPNRRLKRRVWTRYAKDMSEGRWEFTHQGLAFDESGAMTDGTHRCQAVVSSGVTIPILATWGLSRGAQLVMDQGARRAGEDALTIYGMKVDKDTVSIARAMYGGGLRNGMDMSIGELGAFIERHRDAIEFALPVRARSVRGVSQATVAAVVARAWYHEDRGRLAEFLEVLLTGSQASPDDDSAAVLLRNTLILGSRLSVSRPGAAQRKDVYFKTVRGVELFCARRKTLKLYSATADPYPLPAGKDDAA